MPLLERDAQLSSLEETLTSAASGNGLLVLIRGEAGVGKTSLVAEFIGRIAERAHVLTGTCDDLLTSRTLGPIRDMARDEPALSDALESGERERLYDTLLDLSSRRLRPTVLVIEDAQWADGATLDCIRYVGRRVGRTHGLVIVTYRDEDVVEDHPLRFVLGDLPSASVMRMTLLPLSEEAIEVLAGPRARHVFSQTGGNPFYATELLATPGDTPPASIVDSLRSRVARLSPPAIDAVELISVVPGGLVRDALPLLDIEEGVLTEAERGGVLHGTPTRIAFRHELARRAIASSIPATRVAALNARIVESLISLGDDAARIIHHAVAAGDEAALVDHGPRAAREALAIGSYREAHRHFTTLRHVYHRLPPADRARLLRDWSYAAVAASDVEDARTRIDEAIGILRRLGDPEGLGEALRIRSRIAWYRGRSDSAEDYARESVDVLAPLGLTAALAASYSTLAQLAMLDKRPEDAVRWADEAIATAEDLDRPDIVAHALVNKGTALAVGRFPDETQVLRSGIALALETGTTEEAVRGRLNLAWTALDVRCLDEAVELSEQAIEAAEAAELQPLLHYSIGILAIARARQGRWLEAEDLVGPLLALPDLTTPNSIMARTALAIAHVRRGHDDVTQLLDVAEALAARTGELQRTGPLAAIRAEHACVRGDTSTLSATIDRHLEALVSAGAMWDAGEISYWGWRAGLEFPIPDRLPHPHALVISGDWRAAAAAFDDRSMPYEHALMLSHGGADDAVEAVRHLDRLGANPMAAHLRSILRERAVPGIPNPPRRATRAHPAGLTSRQHEVLALLAEGLSNPDIADRLFISPRTVDHHVSAILAKLDVTSRGEAVETALAMGVLEAG